MAKKKTTSATSNLNQSDENLQIKIKLDKTRTLNGNKLTVKVFLMQGDVVVSTDTDFINL